MRERNEVQASGVMVGREPAQRASIQAPPWYALPLPCRGLMDLFFPTSYNHLHTEQVEKAKAVCRTCPAWSECLERALEDPGLEGVWGATTPLERRKIRSTRKKAA